MLENETFKNVLARSRRGEAFRKERKKSAISDEMHLLMTPKTSHVKISYLPDITQIESFFNSN